jgi:hypothetical protein
MMLIILTDSATVTRDDRNAITHYLQSQKWDFWHWMEDVWLISDAPDSLDLNGLGKTIRAIISPNNTFMLLRPRDSRIDCAGVFPPASIEWMTEKIGKHLRRFSQDWKTPE